MIGPIVRISLDLETMSLEPNAAVVQIGASEIFGGEKFLSTINPAEAESNGGHVDVATMEWWGLQEKAARDSVFQGWTKTETACQRFTAWCADRCGGNWESLRVYTKGTLDWYWLKNMYERVQEPFPFHYRSPCDMRSLKDVMTYTELPLSKSFKPYMPHNALSDAIAQGEEIAFMLESLRSAVLYGPEGAA